MVEIFEAMKHPVTGIGFLGPAPSLPSFTFVSYDAILWLHSRMEDPCNPIEILDSMKKERMICHASGDFSKPIISGFYLYFIVIQDKTSKDYRQPLCDLEAFENEWVEVEIINPEITEPHEIGVPKFLHDSLDIQPIDSSLYKQTHLEIDVGQKSDRTEFGHARYHQMMTPGSAFEVAVQWVTASGPIVYELVYGWSRKAAQCGFQLVNIPADPLAEPFTEKSDPLRGPIFVPLDIDCLKQHRIFMFENFKKDSWADRLLLFQEAIVLRFGFMPCVVETNIGSNQTSLDHQYVHCSGNMFILVPSHHSLKSQQRISSNSNKKSPFVNRHHIDSPIQNESYITRHVSGKNKEDGEIIRRIGFLWSWNHMIPNKKWKSLVINNSPDNELFQLKMLRDFKEFCCNQEDRLVNFWDECWEIKEKASIRDCN